MSKYSDKGWVELLVTASRDKARFEGLHRHIEANVQHIMRIATMTQASGILPASYDDNMEKAADKVRQLTGLTDLQLGLQQLADDDRLSELGQVMSLDNAVLRADLKASLNLFGGKVDAVGIKVDEVGANVLMQIDSFKKHVPLSNLPANLPKKLQLDWAGYIGQVPVKWDPFMKQICRLLDERGCYNELMSDLVRRLGIVSETPNMDERFKELAKTVILAGGGPDVDGVAVFDFFYW